MHNRNVWGIFLCAFVKCMLLLILSWDLPEAQESVQLC